MKRCFRAFQTKRVRRSERVVIRNFAIPFLIRYLRLGYTKAPESCVDIPQLFNIRRDGEKILYEHLVKVRTLLWESPARKRRDFRNTGIAYALAQHLASCRPGWPPDGNANRLAFVRTHGELVRPINLDQCPLSFLRYGSRKPTSLSDMGWAIRSLMMS